MSAIHDILADLQRERDEHATAASRLGDQIEEIRKRIDRRFVLYRRESFAPGSRGIWYRFDRETRTFEASFNGGNSYGAYGKDRPNDASKLADMMLAVGLDYDIEYLLTSEGPKRLLARWVRDCLRGVAS